MHIVTIVHVLLVHLLSQCVCIPLSASSNGGTFNSSYDASIHQIKSDFDNSSSNGLVHFRFHDGIYEVIGSYNDAQSFTFSFNGFAAALDWVIWSKIRPQERTSLVRLGAKLTDYTYNMKTTIEWQPVGSQWSWYSTTKALSSLRDHFEQPLLPHPALAVIGAPDAKTLQFTMSAIPYDKLEFRCEDQRFFDTSFIGDFYPTERLPTSDVLQVIHRALDSLASEPIQAELPRGGRQTFTVKEIRLEYSSTENRPERITYDEIAQVIIGLRNFFLEKQRGQFTTFFGAAIRESAPKFHVTLYEAHNVPDIQNLEVGSAGNVTGTAYPKRPFMAPDANLTAVATS